MIFKLNKPILKIAFIIGSWLTSQELCFAAENGLNAPSQGASSPHAIALEESGKLERIAAAPNNNSPAPHSNETMETSSAQGTALSHTDEASKSVIETSTKRKDVIKKSSHKKRKKKHMKKAKTGIHGKKLKAKPTKQ